jgi:hypothetical protein
MITTSRSSSGVSSPFLSAALEWMAKVSFSPSAPMTPSRISLRSRIESSSRVHTSAKRLSSIRSEKAMAPLGGTITSPAYTFSIVSTPRW